VGRSITGEPRKGGIGLFVVTPPKRSRFSAPVPPTPHGRGPLMGLGRQRPPRVGRGMDFCQFGRRGAFRGGRGAGKGGRATIVMKGDQLFPRGSRFCCYRMVGRGWREKLRLLGGIRSRM